MVEPTEYELGKRAGKVDERLDAIDRHFEDINGSVARNADLTSSVMECVEEIRRELIGDRGSAAIRAAILAGETATTRADLDREIERQRSDRLFRTKGRAITFAVGFAVLGGLASQILFG